LARGRELTGATGAANSLRRSMVRISALSCYCRGNRRTRRGVSSRHAHAVSSYGTTIHSLEVASPQELIAVKLTLAWPEFHIASFRRGDALLLMVLGSQARFTTDTVHLTNDHEMQIILHSIKVLTTKG
jgi:hypothetical protein